MTTSGDKITHRVNAAMGGLKKLFRRDRDEHYNSWDMSNKPTVVEPAGEDIRGTVER